MHNAFTAIDYSALSVAPWLKPGGLLTLFGSGIVKPLVFVGLAMLMAYFVIRFVRKGS